MHFVRIRALLAAVGVATISSPARAQDAQDQTAASASKSPATDPEKAESDAKGILPIPEFGGDLWERSYLTGDWGGARAKLADKGIQVNVDWVQTLQSNVTGGLSTGTKYGGLLDYLIKLDLYRMGVVPGGLLKVRAQTRYGESANGLTGSIAPVSSDGFFPLSPDDIAITVSDLTYYQFLSDQFAVFAGKIDTLDGDPNPFASGRGNTQFLNSNFIFNSVLLRSVPYSTLAAGILVVPTKDITISSTIMNTVDSSTTTGFSDFGDGWTWATEANVQYRLGKLPGGQNVSFVYAGDQDFFKIGGRFVLQPGEGIVPPSQDYSWAFTWSGWQYLYTAEEHDGPVNLDDGPPDLQGFGLFARAGWADGDTNPIRWSVSGGLGGRGIIPGRDRDLFGIGYYYISYESSRLTDASLIEDRSQGLEAFYNLMITPATQLTFDLQVIDSFRRNADTAVVLGMRLYLDF